MKTRSINITVALCILSGSLLSCANVARDNPNDPDADNYKYSAITATPSDGSTIAGHEEIVIRFGDEMDPSSLQVSGTLDGNPGAIVAAWSTTTYDNDTVTLTPSANIWEKGAGKTLTVECDSIIGSFTLNRTVEYSFDVEYAVYVNPAAGAENPGSPSNTGTRTAPLSLIQDGIDRANDKYGAANMPTVRVGAGTYQSNYAVSSAPVISMKNGISVYGGYSSDFSARDVSGNETIVEDTSASGGTTSTPNRAVYCETSVTDTASTVLDGFTIKLADGDYTAGIFCQGSMTISYNTIQGKGSFKAERKYAYGMRVTAGTCIISQNVIDPGYASGSGDYTYGIYDAGTNSQISYNTIGGGYAYNTFGIYSAIATTTTLIINNNTIDCGGGGNMAIGIMLDYDSQPQIDYNELTNTISVAHMRGMCEFTSDADPLSLTHNYFNFYASTADHYYYIDDTAAFIAASEWNSISVSLAGDDQTLSSSVWGNTRKE
ncbi:MAG: hypothetical protein EPN93_11960 [Spirochaetes bacterium]|nr:MAG: hypothetical protein EPN93_11960 [Spirochaetota bacterium]